MDADVRAALLQRVAAPSASSAAVGKLGDAVAEGVFDSFDLQRIQKHCDASHENEECAHRMNDYVKGSKVLGDRPPTEVKTAKAKPTCGGHGIGDASTPLIRDTLSKLKQLLPQVTGCSIQRIPMKRCYTCFYPGVLPASRTRTWGELFSEDSCKRAVIKWAWNHHTKITKERCLWAL